MGIVINRNCIKQAKAKTKTAVVDLLSKNERLIFNISNIQTKKQAIVNPLII
jgi:hypothetical protein